MTDVDTAVVPGTRPLFVATVRHDQSSGIELFAHAEGEPVATIRRRTAGRSRVPCA